MTNISSAPIPSASVRSHREDLAVFCRYAGGFWSGKTALRAWLLTLLLAALVAGQMAIQVLWTAWCGWFYDALQSKDLDSILGTMPFVPLIVLGFTVSVTGLLVGGMTLHMSWRGFLTDRLTGRWLRNQAYFRLSQTTLSQGGFADGTPEYRIAEDVRLVVEPLVDLTVGFVTAVVGAVVFTEILWSVGGALEVTVLGVSVVIPGYLSLAAIVYAGLVTLLTITTGAPLSRLVAGRNDAEAKFRAELTRLRENAESIALNRGDAAERHAVSGRYARVAQAWRHMIHCSGVVAMGTNGNIALSPVIPMLLCVPNYIDGSLSLGEVVQLVGAFAATQTAFAWLSQNYLRVSDVMASISRVNDLVLALDRCGEAKAEITVARTGDGSVRVEGVQLRLPDGQALASRIDLTVAPGERVLLTGPSGTGKSTLIRALAGLWPWGSGQIALPQGARIAFVPQRTYLPNGRLRDVALYSTDNTSLPDPVLMALMRRCGLEHLANRLDDTDRWDQMLSGGERQRIAFLRLLIARPAVIVMDESTSAMDEAGEAALMRLLAEELPGATVLSVGHRPSLRAFHTREVTLRKTSMDVVPVDPSNIVVLPSRDAPPRRAVMSAAMSAAAYP